MARELFGTEIGVHIYSQNADTGVAILHGSTEPGSETFSNSAEQGSVYYRTNGEHWQKYLPGTGTDKWRKIATIDDILSLSWRSDRVQVLTSTASPGEGGTIDLVATPLGGDDAPYLTGSDFTEGDSILFGHGGTEVLARVTNITGDVITVTLDQNHVTYPVDPLSDNDVFVVRNYLPDSPDSQEGQAIVLYNGSEYVKIGDFNWDLATGINISSGYTPGTGNPGTSDTVESALEKIDGNVDNLTTTVGVAQGDLNMGSYTGTIVSDSQSAKQNIQELEVDLEALQTAVGIPAEDTDMGVYTGTILSDNGTAKENIQELEIDLDALQTLSGMPAESTHYGTIFTGNIIQDNQDTQGALQDLETAIEGNQQNVVGVTSETTIDEVLVDKYIAMEWYVAIQLTSDHSRRKTYKVNAQHNGTLTLDATEVDDTVHTRLQAGAGFDATVKADLNGTGATQTMRLRVSSTSPGVDVKAARDVWIKY